MRTSGSANLPTEARNRDHLVCRRTQDQNTAGDFGAEDVRNLAMVGHSGAILAIDLHANADGTMRNDGNLEGRGPRPTARGVLPVLTRTRNKMGVF